MIGTKIHTPIGEMLAIFDEEKLCFLNFVDSMDNEQIPYISGYSPACKRLEEEMEAYFSWKIKNFTVEIILAGTSFQRESWNNLLTIPYGNTITYKEQASAMGRSSAFRAVANANGCNRIAIIVPCHRVVRSNGDIGGYAGGVRRKKWLLEHEYKSPIT